MMSTEKLDGSENIIDAQQTNSETNSDLLQFGKSKTKVVTVNEQQEEGFDILKAIMSAKKPEIKTELVELPSRGIPYPDVWGLRKGVRIRSFRTEDKRQGTIDNLIERCIIRNEGDFNYKVKDLISADKQLLYIRIRALTFGENFEQEITCSGCDSEFTYNWKLNELEISYLDVDSYPFYFTLPDSGLKIGFKLLLDKDQEEIRQALNNEAKMRKNFDITAEQNTYYLCKSIVSINGTLVSDLRLKYQWFNTLSIEDSTFIYSVFDSILIGVKITTVTECPYCNRSNLGYLVLNETFLRPKYNKPQGIGVKTIKFNEL